MPTKDTKLMLKDILNMCVTTSSIKVGWMAGDQRGFTRIFTNDADSMQNKDYFFPSMKVARVKVCTEFNNDKPDMVEYLSLIQFSLDANNYEKVSGRDNR